MSEGAGGHACDAALVRAFGFLGKRWNGVLLAVLAAGPSSFGDLRRSVAGISDSMLSGRLGELTAAGLVVRSVDEGPPVSVRYALTDAGEALVPVLRQLSAWAEESLTEERCQSSTPRAMSASPSRSA